MLLVSPTECQSNQGEPDLSEAVDAAVVFDLLAAGHHHPPLDRVDRVGSLKPKGSLNTALLID